MARETVDNQSEEVLVIVLLAEEPEVLTVCIIGIVVIGPLRDLLMLDENATGLAAHGGSPILDIESTEDMREVGFVEVTLGGLHC